MICAPVNIHDERRSILIVVIEKPNFERMKEGDPITLESASLGGKIMAHIAYPQNLSLLIAYSEDDVEMYRLVKAGDIAGLLRFLERNRRWRPEQGDGVMANFHFPQGDEPR